MEQNHYPNHSAQQKIEVKEEGSSKVREYVGAFALVISVIAVVWSLFQIYATSFATFDAISLRAWHILFLFTMTFLLYPTFKKEKKERKLPPVWDVACVGLTIFSFGYLLANYTDIALRGGYLEAFDYIVAGIGVIMIFEGARRVAPSLAVLAAIFFSYNFLGPLIPGAFGHGGFSLTRVLQHMFWGSQGLLGIGVGVSATFIFMFILFAAFLRLSGFTEYINNLALTVAGRTSGGPAKVAVIGSAFMGMINGSALANVATTGTITIPLMKKNGYPLNFAAAVESVSSAGGQFAPPIMGAVGFLMAELLGMPYVTVMLAAIIPAFLYYLTVIMAVHFEAKKRGLRGLSKENIPDFLQVLKTRGHLTVPVVVLLVALFMGYTPLYAAVTSLFSTVVVSWIRKETRMGLRAIIKALDEGARAAVSVGVACVIIGSIIGTVSLTGLGLTFGYQVLGFVGEGQLLLAGILVMVMSIILGMGVPGIAAYVIVATVAAPVLIEVGVQPLAAHLFVLIYASLSNITPPVAMCAYVASGISGADQNKTANIAVMLGLTGFILPFFFIYHPLLLFDGVSVWQSFVAALTASVGVVALASALRNWLLTENGWIVRVLLVLSAFLTIEPTFLYDILGVILFVLILGYQFLTSMKEKSDASEMETSMY